MKFGGRGLGRRPFEGRGIEGRLLGELEAIVIASEKKDSKHIETIGGASSPLIRRHGVDNTSKITHFQVLVVSREVVDVKK